MKCLIFTDKSSDIHGSDFPGCQIYSLKNLNYTDIDETLHTIILELGTEYKNIFIPLSFGQVLSDNLGLRFAIHFRTTSGVNQFSNIYIYGTESYKTILSHELFNIVRTKGVYLVDYNLFELQIISNMVEKNINQSELKSELEKVNLKIPDSLFDEHSIANIWGMYRILELEGISSSNIASLKDSTIKMSNIYFKVLVALNQNNHLVTETIVKSRIRYSETLPGLTIVGKIDLSKLNKRRK
jgi:hypothetical protein